MCVQLIRFFINDFYLLVVYTNLKTASFTLNSCNLLKHTFLPTITLSILINCSNFIINRA